MAFELPLVNARKVGLWNLKDYGSDGRVFYDHNESFGFFYDSEKERTEGIGLPKLRTELKSLLVERGFTPIESSSPQGVSLYFVVPGVGSKIVQVDAYSGGIEAKPVAFYNSRNEENVRAYRAFIDKLEETMRKVTGLIKTGEL